MLMFSRYLRWPGCPGSSKPIRSIPLRCSNRHITASPCAKPEVIITCWGVARTDRTLPRYEASVSRTDGTPATGG